MADNKISALPTCALTTDDLIEVEQPAEAAGTRSRKATLAQAIALALDNDPTLAGDSALKAATQQAVKAFVEDAIADAIAALDPNGASVGVQFIADTSSTSDADPGAGNLRWNHGTQASATVIYLDDATADGASLTAIWPRLNAGGTMFLQHATNQDVWQIWEFTAINDASGYAKLTVTLWGASGSFADIDPMLVTLDKGQGSGAVTSVNGASGAVILTHASITTTQTVTSASTVTPLVNDDKVVISAQAAALTIANPSGTEAEGQGFVIALKDNATARAITFGSNYRPMGAALPTTTILSKWMYIPVIYNATDGKWDVMAVSQQA